MKETDDYSKDNNWYALYKYKYFKYKYIYNKYIL